MATLRLPLRGLASEGAQGIVEQALQQVPGILAVRASTVNNLLEIDYDEIRASDNRIHDALKKAGIIHGAHG